MSRIRARQTRSWWRILRGALPQRVDWWLVSDDTGRLAIHDEFRVERWYAAIWLIVACTSLVAIVLADVLEPATLSFGLITITTAATVWLARAAGGGSCVAIRRRVMDRAMRSPRDGFEPVERLTRYARILLGYTALFVGAVFWYIDPADLLSDPASRGIGVFFLLTVVACGGAVVALGRDRAVNLRATSTLTGLTSMLAVLFLAAVPVPWHLAKEQAGRFEVPGSVQGDIVALAWVGGFVLLAAATMLGAWSLSLAVSTRDELRSLKLTAPRDFTVPRAAVSSRSTVARTRWALGFVWLFLSCTVLGLIASNWLDAARFFSPTTRALSATEFALTQSAQALGAQALGAQALGAPPPSIATGIAVLLLIGLATGGPSLLVGLSVVDLALSRREGLRRVRSQAAAQHPAAERARAVWGSLRKRFQGVELVLVDDPPLVAEAADFGRGRQFIVFGSLHGLLPHELIEPLLLHEGSHLQRGHPRRLQRLRWLGRLSCAGDSFAMAFNDSWRQETEADAILDQEPQRRNLERALRARREAQSIADAGSIELGSMANDPRRSATRSPQDASSSWQDRLDAFLEQYRNGWTLHYWHPPPRLRRDAHEQPPIDTP
ncbi:MAG: hypothetical protein AAGC60_10360 [Acidobacteriota bacterium]